MAKGHGDGGNRQDLQTMRMPQQPRATPRAELPSAGRAQARFLVLPLLRTEPVRPLRAHSPRRFHLPSRRTPGQRTGDGWTVERWNGNTGTLVRHAMAALIALNRPAPYCRLRLELPTTTDEERRRSSEVLSDWFALDEEAVAQYTDLPDTQTKSIFRSPPQRRGAAGGRGDRVSGVACPGLRRLER
jgi:hypothetical protein